MADTRINALSTATVSLSDDFLPIDGTTAGTKKLSAYSPTFGGNATVGGTLTVSGTGSSTVAGTLVVNPIYAATQKLEVQIPHTVSTENYLRVASNTSGNIYGAEYGYGLTSIGDPEIRINRVHAATSTNVIKIPTSTGNVIIGTTTASTTTSSGALVVGGGVGVAGAINAGGILKTTVADAAYNARFFGATGGMRVRGYTDATYGTVVDSLNTAESAYQPLTIASSTLRLNDLTNGAIVTGTGTFTISGTTASTSTSSGALVVSGGVGVAKEMYLGGGLLNVAKAGAGATIEINADSGFASKLAMQRAATNRWTLEVDSSDVLTLKSLGTTAALTMTGTTSAEFVGSIKTGAPSGGTAAAWKLGTVASVSPTSPNRTIEVDIGGTIYYIHAKTTNN